MPLGSCLSLGFGRFGYLLDVRILRLRPVLITVGATVMASVLLALHGGPLWEPLCYAQVAGLTVSTAVTRLLVPVVYAIFILDLKWGKWDQPSTIAPEGKTSELLFDTFTEPQSTYSPILTFQMRYAEFS